MNILIVTAHPSKKGFTHLIAASYEKTSQGRGHQVEILDLYQQNEQQDYLVFEEMNNMPEDLIRTKMQKKIAWADELVFVYPLWWLALPAILKNFIDSNFSVGFAYKYVKAPIIKGRPVGLLKDKTARVFVTCDGANWMYKMMFSPHKLIMKYLVLMFCGIKVKSFVTFDRMRWTGEEKRRKRLEKVALIARGT